MLVITGGDFFLVVSFWGKKKKHFCILIRIMNIPKCYCGNDLLGLFLKTVVKSCTSSQHCSSCSGGIVSSPPPPAKVLNTVKSSVQT